MDHRAALSVITIPKAVQQALLVHAGNEHPNEACGLLAADDDGIRFFYPLTNVAASPTRYTIDPDGHMGALRHAERQGWRLVGVFHSHPDGAGRPSAIDVEAALEPEWFHLILGTDSLRAWSLRGGGVLEEPVSFDT